MAIGSPQWMYSSGSAYEIANSLRFNISDGAYLSRVLPSSDRQKFTISTWFKLGAISSTQAILTTGDYGAGEGFLNVFLNSAGRMTIDDYVQTGGDFYNLRWSTPATGALFRDPSAWYHLIISVDTTQATSSNRVKVYINGSDISSEFTQTTTPSQNANMNINNGYEVFIGGRYNGDWDWDGYLAEVNFVDGTAELPSAFGETGDYGEWKPIEYSGTYGTNGFYLDFKLSAATSSGLGNDASSNSNNWTPSNLASTDQMIDTPTNNFATFNPIQPSETGSADFYEGNLKVNVGDNEEAFGTFGVSSGKWYFEMYYSGPSGSGNNKIAVGIADADNPSNNEQVNHGHTGTTYTTVDIIGVAVNVDGETISFYKNNSIIETNTDWSGKGWTTVKPIVSSGNSGGEEVCVMNFGQDSSFAGNKTAQGNQDSNSIGDFYYTPPSGFLALCTSNLPAVAVIPSEHFNTVIYTGNNSTNAITGVGFQPDLNWIKCRSTGYNNVLNDVLRGTGDLFSDTTAVEADYESVSLQSDGFTLGGTSRVNANTDTFVAWNWKANGSGSSNTNGSINTTATSANVDAGFSISTYTGTGVSATIGHGLSKAPEMIIAKKRNSTGDWMVYANNDPTDYLRMNTTNASTDSNNAWDDTSPTATVWSVGVDGAVNGSGNTYVAYCFHSVDGYSKVGSYTGNGSSDGTFVYTGGRVAWLMVKRSDGVENWVMIDNKRHPINDVNTPRLYPNLSNSEYEDASIYVDYLSNGFKIRSTQNMMNTSGGNYIYLCFFEHPFKHSNAR